MTHFLIRRALAIVATLLVVTVVLYALAMIMPPRERAMLYFPNTQKSLTDEQVERLINLIIRRYGLDDPFLVQYGRWVSRLLHGEWGYSPVARQNVLKALLQRTPASIELILYSLLMFIPLGIVSGLRAASRKGRPVDYRFRLAAFMGASLPPFVLGMVLLSVFWVGLYWFPIGRLGTSESALVYSDSFHTYTGLMTLDGLLNGRPEISLDALRHLVLPVITLSLVHWATLGRITRAAALDELNKAYILAARGRGIPERLLIWRHVLRNVLIPALGSSALSVASLFTSLFVIEIVFLYRGISSLFVESILDVPDISAALGFAIFAVTAVLLLMTILDLLQAAIDPRTREGIF